MSYEVYIDVEHHPKHWDGDGRKVTSADRWVEPEGYDPSDAERMRAVVRSLRSMADEYDPDVRCGHCGKLRHEHFGYPDELPKCFNRYGPITQHDWWEGG